MSNLTRPIQASSIIVSVAEETMAAVNRLFPDKLGHEPDEEEDQDQVLQSLKERAWRAVPAEMDGCIQDVDNDGLLRLAQDRKAIVRMECGIGEFVVQNTALASLALEEPPDEETIVALNASYSINSYRTVDQDPAFGVRQIVDMALKALSPGVNDTSTAIICVDYLTAILARLAPRKFPALRRYEESELRVIAMAPTFENLLVEAFDQIRRNAEGNVSVMSRMLGALDAIASLTDSPCRRRALREQVQRIAELADRTIDSAHDRAWIEERLTRARSARIGAGCINARTTEKGSKMNINSKDFRVRPGEKVKLKKWPTHVKAVYKSKKQYHKLLKSTR